MDISATTESVISEIKYDNNFGTYKKLFPCTYITNANHKTK